MTEQPIGPRAAQYWAQDADRLSTSDHARSVGYNVEGSRVTGPQQGLGRLWQYEVDDDTINRSLGAVIDQTLAFTVIQIWTAETPGA